ncbi:MAG: aminodeoxychorismate synthase component, partial [Pseudomonadota bacterium]
MAAPIPSGPFVLLDDARAGGVPARLYGDPLEIVETQDPAEVADLVARIGAGGDWAGFLSYEAGLALEDRLSLRGRAPNLPLVWFARFAGYHEIPAEQVADWLPDAAGGWAAAPRPRLGRADYAKAHNHVQALITAGDIYQANLTIRADVGTAGHPLAIYAGLRDRARAGFGGVVWTGQDWLLSLSPELFFALKDGRITTKPMKGTAERAGDPAEDARRVAQLQSDAKQRAENLMIVDLLRNDVSRVAQAGSVAVPDLFHVESYPTVHQMISTVTAQLAPGKTVADLLRAIYPCGSITGAPKIRAMEIIADVEPEPRGIYTGSIGRIDANGDAAFNVAIRTLHLPKDATVATLGLGGGIVADSRVDEEWAECLAKGRFVADPRCFDLIETMLFDPERGMPLLNRHLERMQASADALGFVLDAHKARNLLQAATFRLQGPKRIRLLVSRHGQMAIEAADLPARAAGPALVGLADLPVNPDDFRLRHKTTDRAFYDQARLSAGCFEVAFVDPDGFLTEGSFTNIFVEQGGRLLTPPLSRGLLPGVLRAELIDSGRAIESDLTAEDLAG